MTELNRAVWLLLTTRLLIARAAFLAISYTLLVVVVPVLAAALSVVRTGGCSLPWLMVYLVWVAWWRRGHGVTASLSTR